MQGALIESKKNGSLMSVLCDPVARCICMSCSNILFPIIVKKLLMVYLNANIQETIGNGLFEC